MPDSCDLDLSAAGPVLLPGVQRLIVGGKEGRIFLLNTGSLGKGLAATHRSHNASRATINPSVPLEVCENGLPAVG